MSSTLRETTGEYFEQMWSLGDDPWEHGTRFYETRKYDLTVAALQRPRYGLAFEPGCGIGLLTARLATRCDALIASDRHPRAGAGHVRARRARDVDVRLLQLPDGWPDETFDLIVLSEVLYYFTPERVVEILDRAAASLAPGGELVARALPRPGRGAHAHRGRSARAHRRVGRIRALLGLRRTGVPPRRVPAPVIPTAIAIGIPARDEARRIGACLASIAAGRAPQSAFPSPSWSRPIAARTAPSGSRKARSRSPRGGLSGHVIEVNAATAGGARQAACLAAVAATGRPLAQVWLATTDADTTVAPDWLVAQIRWAEAGVDGVAGLVRVDSELPIEIRRRARAVPAAARRRDRTRPRLWGEPRAARRALGGSRRFRTACRRRGPAAVDGRTRSRSPLARCRRRVGHDQRATRRPHTERVRRLPGRPRVVKPIPAQARDG